EGSTDDRRDHDHRRDAVVLHEQYRSRGIDAAGRRRRRPPNAYSGLAPADSANVRHAARRSHRARRHAAQRADRRRACGFRARQEAWMIDVIMITAGTLSFFMNNIGVAALMLPVVVDVARRTRIPASRLLIPLTYGTLLGGLTTLVGTPPNLLIAYALSAS